MTGRKRELIELEDRAWAEFRSILARLSNEQIALIGYYEDWSVKDLMAHLGSWMAEAARVLEQLRNGTYTSWDHDVDELNREWWETWREVDLETVWVELHSSRARMLDEWDGQGSDRLSDVADLWFRESAHEHHAEHLPRLREWAAELTADPG
ncbi:MAG: maleylpyruvate isomerase N-terminal domain-containing protein [Actinomycetota bacterium]